MFEFYDAVTGAWREILHVSEWTGLSAGLLIGLAALAWFVPPARRLAIAIAVLIAVAYLALLYGNHSGASDVRRQWDAANAAADKARRARDAAIEAETEKTFGPEIPALKRQEADFQTQVQDYERKIASSSGVCQLGADALRLRHR